MHLPYTTSRIDAVRSALAPFTRFVTASAWARRDLHDPTMCDFTFGNPHEPPLPRFAAALQQWSVPQTADWFAYKQNEPTPRAVLARSLRTEYKLPIEADDIFLTNGAFAAIAVTLAAITEEDDEVIFVSPAWFFYEALILAHGGQPVRVPCDPHTFDLDLDGIAAAITARTRAIIINSPHNPSGTIYPPTTLQRLGDLLAAASARIGHPIYVLSDEAYRRIVFDDHVFTGPAAFYPNTFMIYTYGKTLLTPGERIGYVALPSTMPDRGGMRAKLLAAQLVTGYAFPNAVLQHALPDLEQLTIPIDQLQRKRDRMVTALQDIGYDVQVPDATFYVLVRSPWADDEAFAALLATHKIFCLPGAVVELPGYLRLSLTASYAMIERAIPLFAAAWRHAHAFAGRSHVPDHVNGR